MTDHDELVPLMPLRDVAEVLAVSVDTVRRLLKRGELSAVRIGAMLRVPRGDVARFITERSTPPRRA